MRKLHVKKPQSLYFWCFGEISFSVQLIWDGFLPHFPIAKMEKSGYYECGFRLVNSIFGSRCHGTKMKVNGVWCPASRSLWDFPQMEDKSVMPKVSRMQSAKAAAHQRGLILGLLTIISIWKSAEYHGMHKQPFTWKIFIVLLESWISTSQ